MDAISHANGGQLAKNDQPANGAAPMAESTAQEAHGASQIGPFDYCPKLGFRERLNLERPQKLGPLDVGLIYFRRHLALRARDYQRLGFARGALKSPPPRVGDRTRAVEA